MIRFDRNKRMIILLSVHRVVGQFECTRKNVGVNNRVVFSHSEGVQLQIQLQQQESKHSRLASNFYDKDSNYLNLHLSISHLSTSISSGPNSAFFIL